jgi:hypothetical protein
MGSDGQYMNREATYGRRVDPYMREHNSYMQGDAVDDPINKKDLGDVDD